MNSSVSKPVALLALVLLMACGGKKETKTSTSIIIEGHYNGNNLYVQNPSASDGIGFCVNEVLINGDRTSDEINTEHFEIDLKASGIREGSPIKVEIKHEKGCEPKILNPDVLN